MLLLALFACDPFDMGPPQAIDDVYCSDVCEVWTNTFGPVDSLETCIRTCQDDPTVTQAFLNCLGVGYPDQTDAIAYRYYLCQDLLGIDVDVGPESPIDTDDTGGDDTDTDTGGDLIPGTSIRVETDDVREHWTAAAQEMAGPLWYAEYGRVVATSPVGGAVATLTLPDVHSEGVDTPAGTGVLYAVFVFDDADGDGEKDADEPIVAYAPSFPLYLTTSTDGRFPSGAWTRLDATAADAFAPGDVTAPFVEPSVAEPAELYVAGTVSSAYTSPGDRVATLNFTETSAELPGRPLDVPLATTWSGVLPATVDAAQLTDGGAYGPQADEWIAAGDSGGDGAFDPPADAWYTVACHGSDPVYLSYVPSPVDANAAMNLAFDGREPGWALFDQDDVGLPDSDAMDLVISDMACSP